MLLSITKLGVKIKAKKLLLIKKYLFAFRFSIFPPFLLKCAFNLPSKSREVLCLIPRQYYYIHYLCVPYFKKLDNRIYFLRFISTAYRLASSNWHNSLNPLVTFFERLKGKNHFFLISLSGIYIFIDYKFMPQTGHSKVLIHGLT